MKQFPGWCYTKHAGTSGTPFRINLIVRVEYQTIIWHSIAARRKDTVCQDDTDKDLFHWTKKREERRIEFFYKSHLHHYMQLVNIRNENNNKSTNYIVMITLGQQS